MTLRNKVANREIYDFLRTVTIKSTYFANKIRKNQIRPNLEHLVPETANPYTIHLAGEYVLDPRKFSNVSTYDPSEGPWIKGFRRTKDTKVNQYKNYWKLINDTSVQRVGTSEIEKIMSPVEHGLYEMQPMVVPGIIDPITGKSHDQEYRMSQMIYDREGFPSTEIPNSDLYVDGIYDEMMYVTSLDTGQTIPFTLENFYVDCALAAGLPETAVHTKTLEAYKIPGRYFDLLCEKYPTQVDLIKAIVYRVPSSKISSLVTMPDLKKLLNATVHEIETFSEANGLSKAYVLEFLTRFKTNKEALDLFGNDIEGSRKDDQLSISERRRTIIAKAENFDLLNCDTERLNETEKTSLKNHVEKICEVFKKRYAVDEYTHEENYDVVLWSALWSVLPMSLIAKRYANIKTPHVSTVHMWDYLESKGLGEYRGYLTEKQTRFMYKNINYLLQHAGQQKALNIIIDNILADYGITMKAKTVVLDSTDSLKVDDPPSIALTQCDSCARRNVSCFKNIKNHLCDEWLGTKSLCKVEPVVLTEEFAGASKEKIINELIVSHGYEPLAAEVKYKRSFIWKDDEIEAIKDDLDRNQIVDMSGKIESLETTIDLEHAGGQEPVVNDDIVEEQRVALRNMRGTYAPTKLLEIVKRTYNPKFEKLFSRFITETFLRMAPQVRADGSLATKITFSYKFDTTEGASEYILSFGEMLAIAYLCFVKEFTVDTLVDNISTYIDSDGNARPVYEFAKDENGNQIEIGKDDDGNPIYLKRLSSWIQERFTDIMNDPGFDIAIPTKAKTTTALKFGKPIVQKDLIEAFKHQDIDIGYEFDLVTNSDDLTKIVKIGDTFYAITGTSDINDNMWKDNPINLQVGDVVVKQINVLGQYVPYKYGNDTLYSYHVNDNEIPVIPTFFRWYYTHLNPDLDLTKEEKELLAHPIRVVQKYEGMTYSPVESSGMAEKDADKAFVPTKDLKDPQVQVHSEYIDPNNGKEYMLFELGRFLDIESILPKWVDITGRISDQSEVARYIDIMFGILEDVYCIASASGSIRVHLACSEFLNRVIASKYINFNLTDTERTHEVEDGSKVAWFSEYISADKELQASFRIINQLKNSTSGWNELSTAILNKLLEGCQISFAQSIIDTNQFKKLKKLVLQLSSYRITIIEEGESTSNTACTAPIVEDIILNRIEREDIIYFDPIGDSVIPPRVGGYMSGMGDSNTGYLMVPSIDLRRVKDKTYYKRSYRDSSLYNNNDSRSVLKLVPRELGAPNASLPEGSIIKTSENGGEMVNVPIFTKWEGYEETSDMFAIVDKQYFVRNEQSKLFVPITTADMAKVPVKTVTVQIPPNAITETVDNEEVVYSVIGKFENYSTGSILPPGMFYEIVNLYSVLGIEEGTPLLIMRNKKYDWFYCKGTTNRTSIDYPAGNMETEFCNGNNLKVQRTPDKFNLQNDFSNEAYSDRFGSTVYRISVPSTEIVWGTPIKSLVLEKLLYPTVNSCFMLSDSTDHVMLMEHINDIDNELNKE